MRYEKYITCSSSGHSVMVLTRQSGFYATLAPPTHQPHHVLHFMHYVAVAIRRPDVQDVAHQLSVWRRGGARNNEYGPKRIFQVFPVSPLPCRRTTSGGSVKRKCIVETANKKRPVCGAVSPALSGVTYRAIQPRDSGLRTWGLPSVHSCTPTIHQKQPVGPFYDGHIAPAQPRFMQQPAVYWQRFTAAQLGPALVRGVPRTRRVAPYEQRGRRKNSAPKATACPCFQIRTLLQPSITCTAWPDGTDYHMCSQSGRDAVRSTQSSLAISKTGMTTSTTVCLLGSLNQKRYFLNWRRSHENTVCVLPTVFVSLTPGHHRFVSVAIA